MEGIIFILNSGTKIRRKDLVLKAANEDGGAHVAAHLTPIYEELTKNGSISYWSFPFGEGYINFNFSELPSRNAHLAAIRAIGWELFNSQELTALTTTS